MKRSNAPHELVNILINRAMYTGKTDKMSIEIPYHELVDHPDQHFANVDLKVTISTEWVREGEEEDEFDWTDPDSESH